MELLKVDIIMFIDPDGPYNPGQKRQVKLQMLGG